MTSVSFRPKPPPGGRTARRAAARRPTEERPPPPVTAAVPLPRAAPVGPVAERDVPGPVAPAGRRAGIPVPSMAPWQLAPVTGEVGLPVFSPVGRRPVDAVLAFLAGAAAEVRIRLRDLPDGGGPPTGPPVRHRGDGELTAALRRPVTRLYLALAATWIAFGAGLVSLAGGLRFSSSTGELVVVPVVVTVLLHVTIARHRGLWDGRLGHGDYVAVLAAVVLASGVAWWRPPAALNDAALKRLDLLVLPLVLAAVLVLVLGLRVLVAGAFPLLFAFLTWPYPWTIAESHTIAGLARVTYETSAWLTSSAGVAVPVRESGDAILRIGQGGGAFEVSVAPACSGFTGIVAYLILGGGSLFLLRGHPLRKAAWLLAGLVAVWLATVVRILVLATAGDLAGSGAALQVLHPYAGLTLDALVFVLMLGVTGRFGLSRAEPRPVAPGLHGDDRGPFPPPAASQVLWRLALVLVVATSVPVLGQAGAFGESTHVVAAGVHRQTTLGALRETDPKARFVGRQPWSRAFFGKASTWNRYSVRGTFPGGRRPTVWVDSITVGTTAALEAHPVLECYTFHRGQVVTTSRARLAGGVTAEATVVRRSEGDVWYSLHWQWPVLVDDELRYERVVLMTAQPRRTEALRVPDRAGPVVVDRRVLAGLTATADRLLGAGGRAG